MNLTVLEGERSPCVCGRDFDWSRLLSPNPEKGDGRRWLICFGGGADDPRWTAWCRLIAESPPAINLAEWPVLLVTTEPAEAQLRSPLYAAFDCATVRTLSDSAGAVGSKLGIRPVDGKYPFTVVQVVNGEAKDRFT